MTTVPPDGTRHHESGGPEATTSDSVVDCAVYVGGERLPGRRTYAEAVEEVRGREEGFVWLGLHNPADEQMRLVAEAFGLSGQAVRSALRAYQRPKFELHGKTAFVVLKTVRHIAHESPVAVNEIVESGEVMAFLGNDFIVTVRHGEHSGLGGLRKDLEAVPARLELGPSAVLFAITDHVVDDCAEAVRAFEADIDRIETLVFAPRSAVGAEQMYLMKREVVELRRSVEPLASLMRGLVERETPLFPARVCAEFRSLDHHLTAVSARVASFDEQLGRLLYATMAKVTMQQNDDVRRITAWAAIIAAPTMIVGVYGMNFDTMPELRWEYGYPTVLAVIVGCCVVLHRMFKRNRWL